MARRSNKSASRAPISPVPATTKKRLRPMLGAGKAQGRLTRLTLIHLPLPQDVVNDIDTLLWLRVTAADHDVEAIRGGKHRIYDEAVEAFLSTYEHRACGALISVSGHGWRTVRVSTP